MFPPRIPTVTVQDVAQKLADGSDFVLLDVREQFEYDLVNLGQAAVLVPLSELAVSQLAALPSEMADRDREVVVYCHHGNRSGQVTAWLRHNGFTNVWNMAGGIDRYALQVDSSLARY